MPSKASRLASRGAVEAIVAAVRERERVSLRLDSSEFMLARQVVLVSLF